MGKNKLNITKNFGFILMCIIFIVTACGININNVYASSENEVTTKLSIEDSSSEANSESNKAEEECAHNYEFCQDKSFSSSCTKKGQKVYICSKCGIEKIEYLNLLKHNYKCKKSQIIYEYVYKIYRCTRCNHELFKTSKIKNKYVSTLKIPGVSLKVKVYQGNTAKKRQAIVNRKNSACYMVIHDDIKVIGDHNNQGFSKIKKCKPGMTLTFNGKKYKCKRKFNGHNTGTALTDNKNREITRSGGDLYLYTCNQNSYNVTLVAWKRVK